MSVQCRLIDNDSDGNREAGDMWYGRVQDPENTFLSLEYRRDWEGKREPIWVVLPNNDWFCVDSQESRHKDERDGHGWTVTGEPPNLTVTPSIHVLNGDETTRWHGFLTNGELVG